MDRVNDLSRTYGFLLAKIGQATVAQFAERLAPLGLRPRHCGLLAAVAAQPAVSQQELGRSLGLVPSAIVPVLDELEAMGAIRRVVTAKNRRRNTLELTTKGKSLLARATKLAHGLDDALLEGLSATERRALMHALDTIATTAGVSAEPETGKK